MKSQEQTVRKYFPCSIIFEPTLDNLVSAIPVAKLPFREMLKVSGVHDFERQGLGKKNHGIELWLEFLTVDPDTGKPEWLKKHLSLYRAAGTGGERRFWIPGLRGLADPGDQIAIGLSTTPPLMAVNLARVGDNQTLVGALGAKFGNPSQDSETEPPQEHETTRVTYEVQRIVRDSALTAAVKEIYDHACQVCGVRLVGGDGRPYAEGAHIDPLSLGGPDVTANILCLCPNHHVLLDTGAIFIREDLMVEERGDGRLDSELRVAPEHSLDPRFFVRQRQRFD